MVQNWSKSQMNILLVRQSSGRALKSYLKCTNELNLFKYRLRCIAVFEMFWAASTYVSTCIHFITAGHSALVIIETYGSFQLDKLDLIRFVAMILLRNTFITPACVLSPHSYSKLAYLPTIRTVNSYQSYCKVNMKLKLGGG